MIRKCCLLKQHLEQKRNSNSYYSKSSRNNTQNTKSRSVRKANNSKRHDNRLPEQEQWTMLLNQIGSIKNKIIRFTSDYSPNKTPKKAGKVLSFNQRNYKSSELNSQTKNCKNYSLSGKRALRQQRALINDIDLNCPMSNSVFPTQNSCMFSRQSGQPITDFINAYYNSRQINLPKQNAESKFLKTQYASANGPNLGHISLVIDSRIGKPLYQEKSTDIDQLGKKIKKLQEKNNYLTQEKLMLQHRLLFEQQEKKELRKMIFSENDKVQQIKADNCDLFCISTPKGSSNRQKVSPIAKYGMKRSQLQEKSPYQAIKDKLGASNYSRDKSRKLITQSNTSSPQSLTKYKANCTKEQRYKTKKQAPFQRIKPSVNISSIKTMHKIANSNEESDFQSRIQDFSDILAIEKQNQRIFESRKTSKNSHIAYDISEAQQTNIHRSKLTIQQKSKGKSSSKCSRYSGNQQKISDSKGRVKDCRDNFPTPIIVQSNIKISENPQFQRRFSPRITFSRDAVPMVYAKNGGNTSKTSVTKLAQKQLESIEVMQIHKKADREKLKMLEIYFERLIQFSRQEQNREKKNKIRKQMSEIALQIQQLREKLEQ